MLLYTIYYIIKFSPFSTLVLITSYCVRFSTTYINVSNVSRGTTEAEYRTIEEQVNVDTGNVERTN